jgi:hypothetical protein
MLHCAALAAFRTNAVLAATFVCAWEPSDVVCRLVEKQTNAPQVMPVVFSTVFVNVFRTLVFAEMKYVRKMRIAEPWNDANKGVVLHHL